MTLRPKQEKFCQEFIKCGNASEAYRQSYNTEKMKTETINRKAKELMDNGKITARIAELNEEIKNDNIADAIEIQETLTRLLRGEISEECVTVESVGVGYSEAKIIEKQVTPKDRIKAGEILAKIRGYFELDNKQKQAPLTINFKRDYE